MRALRTVLWLRRRLAVHELSTIAGVANLAAGIGLMAIAAVGSLVLAAGLAFVLRLAVASGDNNAVSTAWSITLYTVAFLALVVPVMTGAGRSTFDPARLLPFPISRFALYRLALGSEFLSKSHFVWYPALLSTAVVGLVIPSPARAGPFLVLALFTAALVVWGHALVLLVRRILRDRRSRELASVLGLVLVIPLAFLPAVVDLTSEDADRRLEELLTIPGWVTEFSAVLPPSIATRAVMDFRSGRLGPAALETLWLVLWLAAGGTAGWIAFDRLLRAGSGSGERAPAGRETRLGRVRARALDYLPTSVGAVASKELRYLMQSGVGRISLVVMPIITAVPALLAGRHTGTQVLGFDLQEVAFYGLILYATALTGHVQVNAFAWEKTGTATYFTSPLRLRDVFLGKNIGVWLLNLVFGIEALVVWGVLRGLPHPVTIATGLAILASTSVLLSIFGNLTSIAVPVSRPIATVTSSASPIGTLVMIGCLIAGVGIAGLVVLGAEIGGAHSLQIVFAVVILGIVAAVYRGSLPKTESLLTDRREELMNLLGS